MQTKTLGLCGSLRKDSWNLKLLRNFMPSDDATVWKSLEMPLMNEDLEGKPLDSRITEFRAALKASSVVVIASPEYNGSLSPALKNAIDWGTRQENLWVGKIAVLLSASPGALGGVRGLIHLRTVLSGIKTWVIPEQVQLPFADKAFDAEGKLTNEQTLRQIELARESLRNFSKKIL
jgi:chromate reductase